MRSATTPTGFYRVPKRVEHEGSHYSSAGRYKNYLDTYLTQHRLGHRELSFLQSPQGPRIVMDGQPFINFGSNDYLGLAAHPQLRSAFHAGIDVYGGGSGSVRVFSGAFTPQDLFQRQFADFVGTQSAVGFNGGYDANVGAISTLVGKDDLIVVDKFIHASAVDGCRLSGATVRRFEHNSVAHAERFLKLHADQPYGRRLIITEGLFSMDGTVGNIPGLYRLAQLYDAMLYVDDAHGFGVLGQNGRGALNHFGIDPKTDDRLIQMYTLTKAFGTYGAMLCGSSDLIDYLMHACRPFVFSSSFPPAIYQMSIQSLALLREDGDLVERLRANCRMFYTGLRKLNCRTLAASTEVPIQPVVLGGDAVTTLASQALRQRGVFVPAINSPAVPLGTSRLRFSISAAHTEEDLAATLDHLKEVLASPL